MAKEEKKKNQEAEQEEKMDVLGGETCPICHAKTLTLTDSEREVPYFGKVYLFSMSCSSCKYHKADVESVEEHEPAKYTLDITEEKDMQIRVVKSSNATVKMPHIGSITPGPASNGYVTNVEGVLNRFKKILEDQREFAEEEDDKKKAKNLLKKLLRITWGQEKAKLVIEDPTGNSAIISEKAVKGKI